MTLQPARFKVNLTSLLEEKPISDNHLASLQGWFKNNNNKSNKDSCRRDWYSILPHLQRIILVVWFSSRLQSASICLVVQLFGLFVCGGPRWSNTWPQDKISEQQMKMGCILVFLVPTHSHRRIPIPTSLYHTIPYTPIGKPYPCLPYTYSACHTSLTIL